MTRFREPFPILYVDDVARAAALYTSTLGFEEVYRFPDEEPDFVFLRLDPYGIALTSRRGYPERFNPGRDFELCVYAEDVVLAGPVPDDVPVELRGERRELVH